ncbi:MAG: glycoside hydrolase family 2 TIM barrel-domain containing protein [Woeseiaceae bacterium]
MTPRVRATFVALIALVACSVNESPVRSTDFNFGWRFNLADDPAFSAAGFDDSSWRELRLPHDWSIEADFDESLNGATAYLPGGIGWYRKTFATPGTGDELVYLYFDGVYNHSTIWVNGHEIGGQVNGYTPIYFDITERLNRDGEDNVVAVRVDRTRYIDSRWYTGSGIYRDVELVVTDRLHIPIWGTFITTPEVSAERASVELQVDVVNRNDDAQSFELETTVYDPLGAESALDTQALTVAANASLKVAQNFAVRTPALWGVETPHLYRAVTTLRQGDKIIDTYETPFGIRDIRYDADQGFFLNGKNIKIKGVNLHHDAGLVGAAVPDDVWRRRLEKLKEGGTNAIRTAHNPPSKNFLNLCDELGLLVQHEIFDEWDNPKDKRLNQWERHDDYESRGYANWFQKHAEFDLKNAVKRDRNHPSIIQWSIGNEIEWTYPRYKDATGYFDMNAQGNYFHNPPFISPEEIERRFHESPEGEYVLAETAHKLSRWVKELDTTRPVTANLILPSVSHISGYTDALDIVGYSYRRVIYDYGHRLFPDKMIMGAENVGQWHEWKAVEERDFVAGTFLWTGIDYLGEANDAWPRKGIASGLLDYAGFDKPSFHMFKTLWNKAPHVYMTTQTLDDSLYQRGEGGSLLATDRWDQRTWIWQDVNRHWNYEDGAEIVVEVLSNCDEVELSLNGDSLGTQKLADNLDHILKWVLPFAGGVVEARGLGGCDARDSLATAGKPTSLQVSVDRNELPADGYAVAHVVVQLLDEHGNPVRHHDVDIEFEVPAALEVLGVDNGKSEKMIRYRAARLGTHAGRALLMVRALEKGNAVILVTSPGLPRTELVILGERDEQ